MNQNLNNYQLLIQKLDKFTRKYYVNKLIQGSLYTVGIVLALFLVFNVSEYYFYFGTGVRTLFFYSFVSASLGGLA